MKDLITVSKITEQAIENAILYTKFQIILLIVAPIS